MNTRILIPVRFLTTLGFIIASILILYTKDVNIKATYGPYFNATIDDENHRIRILNNASTEVIIAIVISLISTTMVLIGIFGGCTFFNESISMLGEL